MSRLQLLAYLLALAPALAMAQSAVPDSPATSSPPAAPPQKHTPFDAEVIGYLVSRNNVKKLLEKCWHPAADHGGTLRYRVILDGDGKVTTVICRSLPTTTKMEATAPLVLRSSPARPTRSRRPAEAGASRM